MSSWNKATGRLLCTLGFVRMISIGCESLGVRVDVLFFVVLADSNALMMIQNN